MHIILAGVSHKSAPVGVRERLAFAEKAIPEALKALGKVACIHERMILSTCNRVELYATTEDPEKGLEGLVRFLQEWGRVGRSELEGRNLRACRRSKRQGIHREKPRIHT